MPAVRLLIGLTASASIIAFGLLTYSRRHAAVSSNPSLVSNSARSLDHASRLGDTTPNPGALPDIPLTEWAKQLQQEITQGMNPLEVGWETEAFNDAALRQLKRLATVLASPTSLTAGPPTGLLASDFVCQPLRPQDLAIQFQDSTATVLRPSHGSQRSNQRLKESSSLAVAAAPLVDRFGSQQPMKVALKIVSIEDQGNDAETRVMADGDCHRAVGSAQWSATWTCRWTNCRDDAPLLASITVDDYEEVTTQCESGTWLVDTTEAVLGNADGYRDQLLWGMDHWVNRLEQRLRVNRLGHNGIAIGDVDGDGRDDVYVCQTGGLPNRLYIHQPDGTVRDVARAAGVDYLDDTSCALMIDLDNDGDQDLVLVTISGGVVLANDGTGKFQAKAFLPDCQNTFSLTAADYDLDGRLDLYAGRYWPTDENRGEIPIPVPYYDATNGGRNVLLRNAGNWQFDDVTAQVGLDHDNRRFTMAAAWEDLDDDGDIDLYVANDFGRNCWYENTGGKFANRAAAAGIEDVASGMSVSFGDFNHDGRFDIYVGNMFSTAGNRVAYQRRYAQLFDAEGLAKVQRLSRGNTLFSNQADGTFHDVSLAARVTMGRWSWGSVFADLNNDSWDDLVVANGNVTGHDSDDL